MGYEKMIEIEEVPFDLDDVIVMTDHHLTAFIDFVAVVENESRR